MRTGLAPPSDMDRHEVIARLRRRGIFLAQLARKHGYSSNLFYVALDRPYPRVEKIIADALDLRVQDIWPNRVERRRQRAAA